MKIRNTLLLAVLLLFVNDVQAKGASLNSLIEELAPIARLTNGIAIETELSADANKMNDVVAEFLRVGSGDDVAKLKELRVDEVAKELGELYATVEKVPELNVDMAALADTFKALEHMKQGSEVLENKNLTDPSVDLQKDIDLSKDLKSMHFTSLSKFKATAEILNYIKSNSFDSVGEVRNTHLIPLQESVEKMDLQLPYLVNFKQNFEPLKRLEAISEKLRNISEMSTVSRHFTENFKSFSSMAANLDELKTGVGNLKSVVDIQQSIPEIDMDIDEIVSVVKMITSKSSVLRLTAGFPGGVDDVKLLLDDVSSSKFKKILSRGKDTKNLKKALKSLENFHSTLKTVTNVWSPLAHPNQTVVSENVAKILATMSENGQKTPDTTALSKSLELMEKCFVNLKLPSAIPDYSKVDRLVKYAADLSARINVFQKFLEQQKSTFEAVTQKMVPLSKILKPIVADLSNGATKKVWNEIRNFSDTDSIIASLNSIHGEFTKVQSQDPFIALEKSVEFQVIPTVLDSMKGTNMDVMLACLQKTSYNATELDSTLSFGQSAKVMKNKKKEVEEVTSFLADLTTVQTGLLEVESLAPSIQKPPSRRRRAPNSQSLANLKNAPTIATDLGKGVQVLREFAKILENEASVQVAVNADDGLKNAISAIPGVQSVWTDENRKGMGKMVVDLKELNKFAGSVKMDNMTSLWQIFDEAQKTDGVVGVDAKVFNDPISTVLASSSDPKIKGVSGDFKKLGALDLDFAQHKINLKAASFTLQPLQQFFDDYFGNTKASSGAQASGQPPTEPPSSPNIGMIGGIIGGLLLFGAGGWFVRKLLIQKYRWKNRERYWMYEPHYNAKGGSEHVLLLAVHEGRMRTVKKLISEGRCLDVYYPLEVKEGYDLVKTWQTPLHAAVRSFQPKMVELLIRAGADRSLLSSKNETPEQQLTRQLATDPGLSGNCAKMKEIEEIFKKYEKKRFQPRTGQLMPVNQFCICFIYYTDVVSKFKEKYETMMYQSDDIRVGTHAVFEVNDEGILDLDKLQEWDAFKAVMLLFSQKIPVKVDWLTECLKSPKNFYKDYDYRITKVMYKKKVYETLDEWRKWIACRYIPLFAGVEFAVDFYREKEEPMQKMLELLHAEIVGILHAARFCTVGRKSYWFPEESKHWVTCDKWRTKYTRRTLEYALEEGTVRLLEMENFFEYLLAINGPFKMNTNDKTKQGSTQKSATGSTQGSATGSTQATTNSNVSQV